jgi:hypothetical protein
MFCVQCMGIYIPYFMREDFKNTEKMLVDSKICNDSNFPGPLLLTDLKGENTY